MNNPIKIRSHQGMATLIVSITVLVIITLMVFFAAKVGLFDQRMAANEARYKEAFVTAEAGLDFAVQKFNLEFNFSGETEFNAWKARLDTILNNNPPVFVANRTGLSGSAAGSSTPSFGVTIIDTGVSIGAVSVYRFTSTGLGADGTGTATISREVTMKKILGGSSPDAPIVLAGSMGTGGNFNIVGNPNGGGNGIPVSIWTGDPDKDPANDPNGNVEMTGSSATCYIQGFTKNNATCNSELISDRNNTTLSSYNSAFPDILPNDPNFPDDIFQYMFGVARIDWQTVYNMADLKNQVVTDCSSLSATSGQKFRLWWVTGNCDIAAGQIIGSTNDPVILVIDDHEFGMKSNDARIYGISYLFDNPSNVAKPSSSFSSSSAIYGALVSDVGVTAHGSYSIVYEQTLLDNLTDKVNDSANFSIAYIPGSWRDF